MALADELRAVSGRSAPWRDPYAVAEVLAGLDSDCAAGLSEDEAIRRLTRYGPNRLAAVRVRGPLVRLLLQFHSPLIYVLLAAALITAVLGERVDAAVIAGIPPLCRRR